MQRPATNGPSVAPAVLSFVGPLVTREAPGLDDFLNVGRAQVPDAVDKVTQLIRVHADAVIAGKVPATLPCVQGPLPKDEDPQPGADAGQRHFGGG